MPKIRFTGPRIFRRVIGPYNWRQGNGFVCEVDETDVGELITLPGFELDEADKLTRISGIGQTREQELHLRGVVTFRQFSEADTDELARLLCAHRSQVKKWQQEAEGLAESQAQPPIETAANAPRSSG